MILSQEGYDTRYEQNESILSAPAKDPQLVITVYTGSSNTHDGMYFTALIHYSQMLQKNERRYMYIESCAAGLSDFFRRAVVILTLLVVVVVASDADVVWFAD